MKGKSEQSNYMRIHFQIANDIALGVYSVGDLIPTQLELAEKYGVSRATICEAIKELTRRKLLKTVQGKGTFVVGQPLEIGQFNRYEGFTSFRNQHKDRVLTSKIILIEEIDAPQEVSRRLGEAKAKVTHIVRQRFVDGIPMSVESSYLLRRYVNGINFSEENLETGSLYQVLRDRAGLEFSFYDETIKATYAPEKIAYLLGLKPNEPVLVINRVCGPSENTLVENVDIFERSDITHAHYRQSRGTLISAEETKTERAETVPTSRVAQSLLGAAAGRRSVLSNLTEMPADQFLDAWIHCPSDQRTLENVFAQTGLQAETPKALLSSIYPIAYLHTGEDKELGIELATFFSGRFPQNDPGAACAYIFALKRALGGSASADELMEAALLGVRAVGRRVGFLDADVEKRIQFAAQTARDSKNALEALKTWCGLIGNGDDLEAVVPMLLCVAFCKKGTEDNLILDGIETFGSAQTAELYGALAGAMGLAKDIVAEEMDRIKSVRDNYLMKADKIASESKVR